MQAPPQEGSPIPFPPSQQTGQNPQNYSITGAMAGQGPQDMEALQQQQQLDQNAGMIEAIKDLSAGLTQAQDFVMTAANQFPGAAQYARTVIEAMDMANKGLVDLLTAIISQANSPEPMAPRYLG